MPNCPTVPFTFSLVEINIERSSHGLIWMSFEIKCSWSAYCTLLCVLGCPAALILLQTCPILSHKLGACFFHGLHWTFASTSKCIYWIYCSGKYICILYDNGTERKQPCIYRGGEEREKKGCEGALTRQMKDLMYETGITLALSFFLLFALPQQEQSVLYSFKEKNF